MCGYIRRVTDCPEVQALLEELGLGSLVSHFREPSQPEIEHFYPAFGGDPRRQIRSLIVADGEGAKAVDATWWFDCHPEGASLRVGERTTFNARNLESRFWKAALHTRRGLVVATGLGESKWDSGRKKQYLVEAEYPFLLGALFHSFDNGCYSCAVITRDSHPRFEAYHDKAFPCFLPADRRFIDDWLHGSGTLPAGIATYLEQPQITVPLKISRVKTFKRGVSSPEAVRLQADGAA